MSLFKKKSPLRSTRLVAKKRRLVVGRVLLTLSFFVCIGVAVALLSDFNNFSIENIKVEGNVSVDDSDIETLVNKNLAGSYYLLFSRNSRYAYPREQIEKDILTVFPVVKSVFVSEYSGVLTINITERKPSLLWCAGTPADADKLGCYFMDEEGFVFAPAPRFSGDSFLACYGAIISTDPIGKYYLDSSSIRSIVAVRNALNNIGISVRAFSVPDAYSREIYLSSGGKVIYKPTQKTLNLISLIETLGKKTFVFRADQGRELEYIDLRYGNKVYYKFVGDNALQGN
jgi:cell division septal protein FtsQ